MMCLREAGRVETTDAPREARAAGEVRLTGVGAFDVEMSNNYMG